MKRTIVVLLLLVSLVAMVNGLALDFQNVGDFSQQVRCMSNNDVNNGICTYIHNATGGSSWMEMKANMYPGYYAYTVPTPPPVFSTYAAGTGYGNGGNALFCFRAYDAAMTVTGDVCDYYPDSFDYTTTYRYELKFSGLQMKEYREGVLVANGPTLLQYPAYIGMGDTVQSYSMGSVSEIDDMIWGSSTESRYIFGMPETGYFIMKDIINAGNSGFYRVNQTDPNGPPTLISSDKMYTTFGKPNPFPETVIFTSPTGGTQMTYNTTRMGGTIAWSLLTFFSQNPPYGFYQTTINPQTNSSGYAVSKWIPYIGSGASITWDKQLYSQGQTATLTTTISNSYYNTTAYAYKIQILDGNGNSISNQPVTIATGSPHNGSVQYSFTSDNLDGIYYGEILASPKAGGTDILMNYATAGVTSVLTVDGYVFNAQTTNVIPNITVNITQGMATDSNVTTALGVYTSSSTFTANAPTAISVNTSGYEPYQAVFTPTTGGELQINLTLMPTSPTYSDVALGGIVRVAPYNRTVDNAIVSIVNSTSPFGNYTVTTNSVGFYIQNSMTNNFIWNIWANKTGYSGSPVYQKLVVGV